MCGWATTIVLALPGYIFSTLRQACWAASSAGQHAASTCEVNHPRVAEGSQQQGLAPAGQAIPRNDAGGGAGGSAAAASAAAKERMRVATAQEDAVVHESV